MCLLNTLTHSLTHSGMSTGLRMAKKVSHKRLSISSPIFIFFTGTYVFIVTYRDLIYISQGIVSDAVKMWWYIW